MFTASSMGGFRRIEELHGFGKPVAKRFISRSSSYEVANSVDAMSISKFCVDVVVDSSYCESQWAGAA